MSDFSLPDFEYAETPLGVALRECEVFCIADCCGMDAYDITVERFQEWADRVTAADLEVVRREVENALVALKEAPEKFFFLDCDHTRGEVTEWIESVRVALAGVKAGDKGMLQHQLLPDKGILVLLPQGKLTEADFAAVSGLVDPYIEKNGALRGILIDAPEFPGWENFAALSSHLKFVKGHHQKVGKIAAVSDSTFMKFAPALANHFVKAEVRAFEPAQKEEAMAWLEE